MLYAGFEPVTLHPAGTYSLIVTAFGGLSPLMTERVTLRSVPEVTDVGISLLTVTIVDDRVVVVPSIVVEVVEVLVVEVVVSELIGTDVSPDMSLIVPLPVSGSLYI